MKTIIFISSAVIIVGSVIGAIGWAIFHIASGKFREEYEIATIQKEDSSNENEENRNTK